MEALDQTFTPPADIDARRSRALVAGGVGLAACALGVVIDRDHFFRAWLVSYMLVLGIALGSLALMMVQHLSGGTWGVFRRIFEAASRTLPLLAVLFVPIAVNLPTLYSWARPEAADDHLIHLKAAYLNTPFFVGRAVLFFVIWGLLALLLNKWSSQQDVDPAVGPGPLDRRFRLLSGPGLVLWVLTVTFMSVDWVMSVDPHWYSTIFGVLMLGNMGLSTLAFTIIVLASLVRFPPMSQVANADSFHDLGKLMLAFLMLWAYFAVSQLLIIWSANLPEEIPFYLERLTGPWASVSISLLVVQFVLPFLFLLSRDLKRNPVAVRRVAMLILLMRVVDTVWTIGPVFRHGSTLHWLDFAMVLAIGCLWLPLFWRALAGRPLVPARDPYFKEAMIHGGN